MLVLSRKQNEEIVISNGEDTILISIVNIRPNAVRLGLIAPKHIRIDRKEVFNKRQHAATIAAVLDRD